MFFKATLTDSYFRENWGFEYLQIGHSETQKSIWTGRKGGFCSTFAENRGKYNTPRFSQKNISIGRKRHSSGFAKNQENL